jgi:hypothetical protein
MGLNLAASEAVGNRNLAAPRPAGANFDDRHGATGGDLGGHRAVAKK